MKSNRWIGGLAAGVALAVCLAATAFGEIIVYSQNFEAPTYTLGSIVGQDSWVAESGASSVLDGPAGTLNTSQVLGSAANAGGTPVVRRTVDFDFQGEPEGILRFDFYRDIDGDGVSYTGLGVANNSAVGMAFIVAGGSRITYRERVNAGFTFHMTDIDGNSASVLQDTNWFRLEARFHIADNTITMVTIQNLTTGADPVQLYFGANTPTILMTNLVTDWSRLVVRTAGKDANTNSHNVYYDNIQVVAIPEPGTLATLTLAVAGLAGWIRRRRAA